MKQHFQGFAPNGKQPTHLSVLWCLELYGPVLLGEELLHHVLPLSPYSPMRDHWRCLPSQRPMLPVLVAVLCDAAMNMCHIIYETNKGLFVYTLGLCLNRDSSISTTVPGPPRMIWGSRRSLVVHTSLNHLHTCCSPPQSLAPGHRQRKAGRPQAVTRGWQWLGRQEKKMAQ